MLALFVVVSNGANNSVVSAAELNEQVTQEKQRLLDGVAEGEILHIATASHDPSASTTASGAPWVYPEYTTGDIWMGVDDAGGFTTCVVVTKNMAGDVLATMELQGGTLVSTWRSTGDQLVVSVPLDVTLAAWLESVATGPPALTDNAVQKEAGTLDGKPSVIFEEQVVVDLPGQNAKTLVYRSEFVAESPLLFQTTTYEIDQNGARSLTYLDRFRSYELLPADTKIDFD